MDDRIIHYTDAQRTTVEMLIENGFERVGLVLYAGTIEEEHYFHSDGSRVDINYKDSTPPTYTWKEN